MKKIEIPAIGQTLSRQLMPQLADSKAFVQKLKDEGIDFTEKDFDTSSLKSTQADFDDMKVLQMMHTTEKKSPIVISRDSHILDGHHRWIADHNTTGSTRAFMVDLPILDLVKKAHDYNNLNEEINHQDFGPMLDSFVSFASEKLGIKSLPKLKYKDAEENFTSFGGYSPSEKSIVVVTKNRHPMDIFRTVAHELVHCKQDEDGRIKDVAKEGETGSDIENEANAMAGQIMRWYGRANPDKFSLKHMVEEKMNEACWKGYYQPKDKKLKPKKGNPGQFVPNCVPKKKVDEDFDNFIKENTPSDREWGKTSLTKIYADATPGQTFPFNPLFEEKPKKKIVRKKLTEDGLLGSTLDMYNTPYTLPSSDTIGPEFGNRYSGISGFGAGIQSSLGTGYSYPFGTLAEKARETFQKHLKELQDYAQMGTVPKQGLDRELSEASPAWQRKEGKDPEGGLNKKGVASYRRANPGSKLQTAVTTKPSKLKPGSKKAKRRLSFCRRMKGMKSKLTSAKTARDPDSRINKSLRKWNCEE